MSESHPTADTDILFTKFSFTFGTEHVKLIHSSRSNCISILPVACTKARIAAGVNSQSVTSIPGTLTLSDTVISHNGSVASLQISIEKVALPSKPGI